MGDSLSYLDNLLVVINYRSSLLVTYALPFRTLKRCVLVLSTEFCRLEENHDTRRHVCVQNKKLSPNP